MSSENFVLSLIDKTQYKHYSFFSTNIARKMIIIIIFLLYEGFYFNVNLIVFVVVDNKFFANIDITYSEMIFS
jgi:hypothetical protein